MMASLRQRRSLWRRRRKMPAKWNALKFASMTWGQAKAVFLFSRRLVSFRILPTSRLSCSVPSWRSWVSCVLAWPRPESWGCTQGNPHATCSRLPALQHGHKQGLSSRQAINSSWAAHSHAWLVQGQDWKSSPAQITLHQGGRTWQAFGGGKNGHVTFRQARIYNFRDSNSEDEAVRAEFFMSFL